MHGLFNLNEKSLHFRREFSLPTHNIYFANNDEKKKKKGEKKKKFIEWRQCCITKSPEIQHSKKANTNPIISTICLSKVDTCRKGKKNVHENVW